MLKHTLEEVYHTQVLNLPPGNVPEYSKDLVLLDNFVRRSCISVVYDHPKRVAGRRQDGHWLSACSNFDRNKAILGFMVEETLGLTAWMPENPV